MSSLTLVLSGCKMPPDKNGGILHTLCARVNNDTRCKAVYNQGLHAVSGDTLKEGSSHAFPRPSVMLPTLIIVALMWLKPG